MDVCDDGQIYMHLEKDGSVFSVDNCSLSDLPEYEESMEPEGLVLEMAQRIHSTNTVESSTGKQNTKRQGRRRNGSYQK